MPQKNVNDHVFTNGDGGVPILAVQISASANALSSEGKYAPLQVDSNGALKVAGSLSTTPSGTQNVNVTQIGGVTAATAAAGTLAVGDVVNAIDISAYTASGSKGVPIMAQRSDTNTTVFDGYFGILRMDLARNLFTSLRDLGGNTVATAGAGILSVGIGASGSSVIGSLAANQTVNVAQIGGQTPATGGTGILSVNTQLLAGQAFATAGTGVQQVASNVNQIGGQTLATAATGIPKVGVTDGSGNVITSTSNAIDINLKTSDVAIGGGTQYKMDTTTASATGTLGLGYDGSIIRAFLTDSTGRQVTNVGAIGGNTAATAGSGILSVGINTAQNAINVTQIGGTTPATGGTGILSFNEQLLAGQAVATAGTGIQQVGSNINQIGGVTTVTAAAGVIKVGSDLYQIGSQTAATAGTGILKIGADIFQVGGSATITASAGIMRTHTIKADDVATIYSSGAPKKPVFLQISASASGSNILIASAASTSYLILAYNFNANGAVNAQFLSSATPMGGVMYMPTAGVGKVAPYSPVGWMQTTAGHSLNFNLSANMAVGGELVYIAI